MAKYFKLTNWLPVVGLVLLIGLPEKVMAGCLDDIVKETGLARQTDCDVKTPKTFTLSYDNNRKVVLAWKAYDLLIYGDSDYEEDRNEKGSIVQIINGNETVIDSRPPITGSRTVNLNQDGVYSFCFRSKGFSGRTYPTPRSGSYITKEVCRTVAVTSTPATLSYPSTDRDGAYAISWSSSGADRYELYRRVNGGSWSRVYNSAATSFNESGRPNGNYQYRVRACIPNMCSGYKTGGILRLI